MGCEGTSTCVNNINYKGVCQDGLVLGIRNKWIYQAKQAPQNTRHSFCKMPWFAPKNVFEIPSNTPIQSQLFLILHYLK